MSNESRQSHRAGLPRLLIAEDESVVTFDYANIASHSNWEVIGPVNTLTAALSELERNEIGAALLDYRLADAMVEPLTSALAAKNIPFVVITAYDLSEYLVQSRSAALRVVQKPYGEQEIVELLGILYDKSKKVH